VFTTHLVQGLSWIFITQERRIRIHQGTIHEEKEQTSLVFLPNAGSAFFMVLYGTSTLNLLNVLPCCQSFQCATLLSQNTTFISIHLPVVRSVCQWVSSGGCAPKIIIMICSKRDFCPRRLGKCVRGTCMNVSLQMKRRKQNCLSDFFFFLTH